MSTEPPIEMMESLHWCKIGTTDLQGANSSKPSLVLQTRERKEKQHARHVSI